MTEENKLIESPLYHLTMRVNDEIKECDTRDLKESILAFAPRFVKTKVKFEITNSAGKTFEKQFFVQKAKQIFRNKLYMNFFLKHMMFK